MAYATSTEYTTELLELASSKVDDLTFNRIRAIGFDNLTAFQQEKVQSATLHQAKFYDDYGTDVESLSGYSLLDISMSFNTNGVKYAGVSPMAIMELKQTGLMRRVIG